MSDTLDLIKAILRQDCPDDETARQVLHAALEREIDVLVYCAVILGIGEAPAMERAAAWLDMAYFDVVPRNLSGSSAPVRLDALADIKCFRVMVLDIDVLFCAPDFSNLLAMKAYRRRHPALARQVCLVPASALRAYLVNACSSALIDGARQNLARRWPYAAAQLELTRPARWLFVSGLLVLLGAVILMPFLGPSVLGLLVLAMLAVPAAIRLAAIRHALVTPVAAAPEPIPDAELPVYSVLIPLRNEAHMVPQLQRAMAALDYPADKLDIKFVVEARSAATLVAVRQLLDDPRFSLVPVPEALPLTKPKALDFALPLCRGQHVVVYDAEDTPDPGQLRLAAARFRAEPDIECLQAELLIDNGRESLLTGLFAGEYAGLFGVMLPALAAWGLPVPLGGTSNHFRVSTLRALGGWDAFNVTEDADLGMRLARMRYRIGVLASSTQEEAPIRLKTWMNQRTRWLKGWMQTFIVHNRSPLRLYKEMGLVPMLVFEFLVLGMIVAPLLHCAFLLTLVGRLALGLPALPDTPLSWQVLYLGVFALGHGAVMAQTLLGLHRHRRYHLMLQQLALPFYWLLIAFAALRAVRELLDRPFHWAKTEHRPILSRRRHRHRSGTAPAPQVAPVYSAAGKLTP
ncbi:Glycosyltransferase, catalytic subunit of cellulose synthase and poly-beta-1,6-N-acetylglucosamine synthase [Devosia limi DSM 17137]|uniref:Glycosyltransferase, catalytic subunit of cellulose synthase and poly-beta-1,6-N-acetylglucosamine synthase n=1 Tax=Devosia limi DSM 17137 TaxID=1121477 RepID=A0A1M5BFF4_9HYPH|nr:Glycosyltransferase, catalytic subunit of cellulose synthase and poly-beta-1,6-N-acetylglucosamine synthase [Devosia limi DSM 17137]